MRACLVVCVLAVLAAAPAAARRHDPEKMPATRSKRSRGVWIASQKNSGNRTDVNRPSDRKRWATTGGTMLTAIHNP